MELTRNNVYLKEILHMIKSFGYEHTEDYLCAELSSLTKDVIAMKEKTASIENAISNNTNTDEVMHLKYDLIEARTLLDTLLKKLKAADERYVFFKTQANRTSDLDSLFM